MPLRVCCALVAFSGELHGDIAVLPGIRFVKTPGVSPSTVDARAAPEVEAT